ncbi:MAG TPA: glutaredoxin family protein [Solimonas sp.]|nr:glutaredoxin family protein [Solimonas sp.]
MSEASGRRFLLLVRPDCHLCEAFEDELREHLAGQVYALDHANVDDRGEWRMRFGTRIPVLLDERGRVRAEGRFDPTAFDASASG